MVNIRQLRNAPLPASGDLQVVDAQFKEKIGQAQRMEWRKAPFLETFWLWWDRTVVLEAVDKWVDHERHSEYERLVARWLLASPGSAFDQLAPRPSTDTYAVALHRALCLLEEARPARTLQDMEIWVNLYDQWGKSRAKRGESWTKLISKSHRLQEVRRQLCVWGCLQA